ncbi:SDR family oxidoreductase [Paenisporosarcina sp. TG20]|uniref:SDR family NAD(P)-dependent oxidoreductase n=1 Tax=Paenisporosarcina sp. TG20 TaxID=1211706 RepID=UPI000303D3B6|nr:SDR family NAD(P)-dependent oxidoreductase [Paenisporosarcina sp. TG20]
MHKPKTVLITGATSGVGLQVSKDLHLKGYNVYATGRSKIVLKELESLGIHTIEADLLVEDSVEKVTNLCPTPDIVVFSAGIGTFALAHDTTDEQIEQMMRVNVTVPMKLTSRILPNMLERKSGHLIYVASQAGKVATPKASVYAATKHALLGYANATRMEVQPYGIHVTTINPGPIDTPFLDLADSTGTYKTSLKKFLLSVSEVSNAIVRVIERPEREVNLPWYMGISSKVYSIAPGVIERVGRKFFAKK